MNREELKSKLKNLETTINKSLSKAKKQIIRLNNKVDKNDKETFLQFFLLKAMYFKRNFQKEEFNHTLDFLLSQPLHDFPSIESKVDYYLGIKYMNENLWKEAENLFLSSEKFFKEKNDIIFLSRTKLALGILYLNENCIEKAINKMQSAYSILASHPNSTDLANAANWLGIAFKNIHLHDISINYYYEALNIFEKNSEILGICNTLNNIGMSALNNCELNKAEKYFREALKRSSAIKYNFMTANALNNLALIARERNNEKKAYNYLKRALKYSDYERDINSYFCIVNSLLESAIKLNITDFPQDILGKFMKISRISNDKNYYISVVTKMILLKLDASDKDEIREKIAENIRLIRQYPITLSRKKEFFSVVKDFYKIQADFKKALFYAEKVVETKKELNIQNIEKKEKIVAKQIKILDKFNINDKTNKELIKKNDLLYEYKKQISDLERKNTALAVGVTVNHEIRQPLTVIKNSLEMIRINPQKLEKYSKIMEENIDRISKLLEKYKNEKDVEFTLYSDEEKMIEFKE